MAELFDKHSANGSVRTSRVSSGVSTPLQSPIEKTDSIINLTKPALYSIYNDNSATALNRDDDDEENDSTVMFVAPGSNVSSEQSPKTVQEPVAITVIKFVVKIGFLTVCAFIYNELTKQIKNNHLQVGAHTFQPLYLSEHFISNSLRQTKPLATLIGETGDVINYIVVLVVQGSVMGLLYPMLDIIVPAKYNRRILSSNPDPKKRNEPATIFNDTLRLTITFLGISYAIRHLEWSSSLQVSVVWSLLSPCLWLLLDGTLPGLLACITGTGYGCGFVYILNLESLNRYSLTSTPDFVPIWLWTSSFFFCGMIIFGKISRALF